MSSCGMVLCMLVQKDALSLQSPVPLGDNHESLGKSHFLPPRLLMSGCPKHSNVTAML